MLIRVRAAGVDRGTWHLMTGVPHLVRLAYGLRGPRNPAAKPAEVGFAEAATVAVSGLAALQGVRDHGRVEQGQQVLVIGASGGVGSFAVQVAKVRGARVTDVTAGGRRWDVVLDIGGTS